jgi:predicted Zn-dependent protease
LLFSCERCGIPFLTDHLLPHAEHQCADCASGHVPAQLPDAALAAATEGEVRAALGARWRLLFSASLQPYLDRIARQIADRIEGALPGVEVLLVDDPSLRMLALPSGTLLCSIGTLLFLEDEAELCFLLGHELSHAASGDAAVRLVRLGFDAAARENGHDPEAWADAALDLVRLGYGRRRERDADSRALEAVLDLGYDPESALRYLRRVQARMDQGDPTVAEAAASHPVPMDRIRRIERALYGRVKEERVVKVNREVFRRVVGRDTLGATLTSRPWKEAAAPRSSESDAPPRRAGTALSLGVGIALVAGIILFIGWLLIR